MKSYVSNTAISDPYFCPREQMLALLSIMIILFHKAKFITSGILAGKMCHIRFNEQMSKCNAKIKRIFVRQPQEMLSGWQQKHVLRHIYSVA